MTSPYVGQIMMFGGNFAPLNWAMCNGQQLAISQYNALYALLGTTYGGNGTTTFNLPDMQSRVPVHVGTGLGLSPYVLGQAAGTEEVTLTSTTMPQHSHPFNATTATATVATVGGNITGAIVSTKHFYLTQGGGPAPVITQMNPSAVTNTGGSLPHPNLMPSLCITFCIALYGVYPTQS